uniref:RING-type domain-containing protein n=1 Tax=Emiliania huxleyi TaxID=2903 RepID=A0A7S3SAE1_EMIHU
MWSKREPEPCCRAGRRGRRHGLLPFRPHRLLLLLGRRRRAAAASPPATRRARRPRGLLPAARRATLSLGAGGCGRGPSASLTDELAQRNTARHRLRVDGDCCHQVPRFTAAEISQLRSFPFELSGAAADSSARSECAICLCEFESGQQLTALPCAAAHAFHSECVRGALAASVHCPLCRVDVRSLVVSAAAPSDGPAAAPASPRSLGFTRDGGIIQRYDPHPPAALERPATLPLWANSFIN